MGIEPTPPAWKAEVLPLNHTRDARLLVEGAGFEPAKALPSDLQSDPFGRSGTPPGIEFYKIIIKPKFLKSNFNDLYNNYKCTNAIKQVSN